MKTQNLLSAKATILTLFILLGINGASIASSFTASFNGNWSNASNWVGNNPGFLVSNGDKVVIPAGVTLTLDSALTVDGQITLNGGTLNLNGYNLTINGGISCVGLGSIIGNKNSSVAFNGFGGEGNLVFAQDAQVINSLTLNIGSNGGMYLGSSLTITGTLSLVKGYLGIGNNDLMVSGKGNVEGGSHLSYVMNNGTGRLLTAVPNNGTPYMFQVGTQNSYAPVAITNNSTSAGIFAVSAVEGVLSEGTTGSNLCDDLRMVNTSWSVSSSITTGTNVSLEMFWNTNMQVNGFNNTQAYASQYTANSWRVEEASASTLNSNNTLSLKLASVTTLSQYAIFGKTTTTAINNIAPESSFSIYPNPANQSINVSVAETSNLPILKIYDVAGNEVISQQVENNTTAVNINQLSKGVYFASLNGATAKQFVKE